MRPLLAQVAAHELGAAAYAIERGTRRLESPPITQTYPAIGVEITLLGWVASHLVALVRAGATFISSILVERPGEDAQTEAADRSLIHRPGWTGAQTAGAGWATC
jgi:hypothetical protein